MAQNFIPGDFLVFQLESGFGILRVIAVDDVDGGPVWHLAGFDEFFLDVDHAEQTIYGDRRPVPSRRHIALTNRAFQSTQVAKLGNIELTDDDRAAYLRWRDDPAREISDRSVRLMLGLR